VVAHQENDVREQEGNFTAGMSRKKVQLVRIVADKQRGGSGITTGATDVLAQTGV
jgi:hypothetical protein